MNFTECPFFVSLEMIYCIYIISFFILSSSASQKFPDFNFIVLMSLHFNFIFVSTVLLLCFLMHTQKILPTPPSHQSVVLIKSCMFSFLSEKKKNQLFKSHLFISSLLEQQSSLGMSQSVFHMSLISVLHCEPFLLSFQIINSILTMDLLTLYVCYVDIILSFISVALFSIYRLSLGSVSYPPFLGFLSFLVLFFKLMCRIFYFSEGLECY